MDTSEFISIGDAAEKFGVSRVTMWRLIKNASLPVYMSAIDRRVRLVRVDDLEALFRPQLLDEGKEAA